MIYAAKPSFRGPDKELTRLDTCRVRPIVIAAFSVGSFPNNDQIMVKGDGLDILIEVSRAVAVFELFPIKSISERFEVPHRGTDIIAVQIIAAISPPVRRLGIFNC